MVPSIGILSSVRDTQSFVNDKHRSQKGVCLVRNGWKDIYMLRYKRYTSLDLGSTRMGSDHWSCLSFALYNEGINYGHTSGSDSRPPTTDQSLHCLRNLDCWCIVQGCNSAWKPTPLHFVPALKNFGFKEVLNLVSMVCGIKSMSFFTDIIPYAQNVMWFCDFPAVSRLWRGANPGEY